MFDMHPIVIVIFVQIEHRLQLNKSHTAIHLLIVCGKYSFIVLRLGVIELLESGVSINRKLEVKKILFCL